MLDVAGAFSTRTVITRFQSRIQQGAWLLATALILISPFGNAAEHEPDAPENIPAELEGEAWQQISAQIEADRHRMRETDGQWRAHTPGQRYSTRFGPEGPELEVRDGERSHSIGFRFEGAQVDGRPLTLSAPDPVADDNRMEYRRGALTEWYVNRPEGLEQGFTIDRAPAGNSLSVELTLDATLAKHLTDNELVLTENGREVFRYAGLKAWDAEGRTLVAQMELDDSRLVLKVDVSKADYPVTVDPVMFNEIAKLTPDSSPGAFGDAGDWAGRSVSIYGDRALIGAPGYHDNAHSDHEEAFVFERDAGTENWEFIARLAPSDVNAESWFGISVSLWDDRALVGAMWDDDNGTKSGSAYIFDFDGTDWQETDKLLPNDGSEYSEFGTAVSLREDRALVGARGGNAAYVFDFDGAGWDETSKLQSNDGTKDNGFGVAVSLWNDIALIGASLDSDNGTNSGSAYVFEFNGTGWQEIDKLQPSDGDEEDFFGSAVSLSGSRALIGASWDEDNGTWSGSAYIFDFDGTNWNETEKLKPADGAEYDEFGYGVSLLDDHALVGAPGSAASYIFEFDDSDWNEIKKLLPDDGAVSDGIGWAVSLSGDHALVGAPRDRDHGPNSGSAYVFDVNGNGWNETDKLLAPGDEARDDHFGQSVSLSGDRALIGAPGDEDNGPASGSAYVFEFDGTGWSKTANLLPEGGVEFDRFGQSVSLSGDRALIGAPRDDDNGPQSGSAYVFDFDGTDWSETRKLLAGDGADDDQFGHAVSLSGNRALIGAFGDDDNGLESGSAYLFEFDGTGWNETDKLLPGDGTEEDQFGYAVSLSNGRALIGAPGPLNSFGHTSGSAYIFEFNDTDWSEINKLLASDGYVQDGFGRSVSLSGDRALIGTPRDDDNGYQSGSAYIFEFNGTNWNESFKLVTGDGVKEERFGSAVSLSGNRALVGAIYGGSLDGTYRPGSANLFELNDGTWDEVDKLLPSRGGGSFGAAVSLSGNRALIGTPMDGDNGPDSGSVYFYMVTRIFSDHFEN